MWLIHKTGHSGATSQTVATCGGEAVCVIDCQTGIVLHKYKVPGEVSAGPSSPRLLGPGTGTLTLFLVILFWRGWNPGCRAHCKCSASEPFPQLLAAYSSLGAFLCC